MSKYKLILLPMMENMTPEWAEAIRQYVEQGGFVIAECPFAFKDGDNCLHGRTPIYGLEEVFGAWTNDREGRESAPKMNVFREGGPADVFFYWHELHETTSFPWAEYETGTPAIVGNLYGHGDAYMAGTEIFRQYFSEPQEATTNLLEYLLEEMDVTPTARVLVNGDDSPGSLVEVAKLEGTAGVVYIIMNHNEEERLVEVFLTENDLTDMETGEPFDGKAFILPPLGARALFSTWGNMKKMDKTPLNRAEEKFLNDFIKKYDIERRARESAEIFLNVDDPKNYKSLKICFDVLNPENLRLADKIGYALGKETVITKIYVLENNQRKFVCVNQFTKDGEEVEAWLDDLDEKKVYIGL